MKNTAPITKVTLNERGKQTTWNDTRHPVEILRAAKKYIKEKTQ